MVGCSTCGRELTYIAQYDRYYCYSCRAYAPKETKPCPQCNRALVYVPQYQRYYCYGCQEYKQVAPVAVQPAQASNACPTCGRELSFIQQYNRYYCYNCKAYAPLKREASLAPPAAGASGSPPVLRVTPTVQTTSTSSSPTATTLPAIAQTSSSQTPPKVEAKASTGKAVAFSRQDLDGASKDQLMRWCQEYGLDASGMKYELRLRIMEYMRSHGLDFREGEGPSAAAEAKPGPSAAESGRPEGSEIVIEAIDETEEEQEQIEVPAASAVVAAATQPDAQHAPQPTAQGVPQHPGQPVGTPRAEVPGAIHPAPPMAPQIPRVAPPVQLSPAPRVESTPRPACPTCGGPLSYIAQYDRHYCYRCRAYAPRQVTTAIGASAPFTSPPLASAQAYSGYPVSQSTGYPQVAYQTQRPQTMPVQSQVMAQAAPRQHGGGNIMMGVYLMLLGLALYGVYEFLANFPPDLNFGASVVPPAVAFALRFLGLFFVVVGAVLGLILIYQRLEAKV